MKALTCYKTLPPDSIAGGVGQGGGRYWELAVGLSLQRSIADVLDMPLEVCPRPHGIDSFDRHPYDIPDGDHDLAYLQLFEIPHRRPSGFVYSIISDYIGMEDVLEDFLSQVKPNVMISFQYPLEPPEDLPGLPQLGKLPKLVEQCGAHGCKVVYLPWFNAEFVDMYDGDKDITAMCTGKMSGTYPFRDMAYRHFEKLGREDIVISGNPTGSTFRLSDEEYRDCLSRCRYYVSGGIYDLQIPPKYYEVCNYGACLISPEMPMMEASGFVNGETYLKAETMDDVMRIIADPDRWREIGRAGWKMVQQRHSLPQRAWDIAELFKEWRAKQ
jgi:hypothetical protein